ncbi:MAG TPA: 7-cyano-7-deazaguanine synthase QueC [Usitatibacter sp.]|nr:7-cyano-7-deazaguanine synthase QueC [Usitatibacter sp.]
MSNGEPKAKALVLFSGGQDSTTCLAWALSRYQHVETVGFDYGQRHRVELDCRLTILDRIRREHPAWANRLREDHLVELEFLRSLSDTALTRDVEISMLANGLPNTFVPGRNVFFLTAAAALAYRRGLQVLVAGVCETDYSGYPDCRDSTIKSLQATLELALASRVVVETPLMWVDKAETWRMAKNLGGSSFVRLIIEETHTCYLGQRDKIHPWGRGCGSCPSCLLRSQGFAKCFEVVESAHV